VVALAKGWQNDSETLFWLKTCAQLDKDGAVRSVAVAVLAHRWQNDPETLLRLQNCVVVDEDWAVRHIGLHELASRWKDKPGMFKFLCDRAVSDPFVREEDWQPNPRQTALEAIIEHYPDHPQTLPLLHDRAENDPDKQVREFAKEKLQEWRVRK
jgi:hypothetical protein